MYVFEISKPGTWLTGIPDHDRGETEALVRLLITCIEDAAVSLALFEDCLSDGDDFQKLLIQREADFERERTIASRLEAQILPSLEPEERFAASAEIRELAVAQAKKEAWAEGRIPDSYVRRRPFIHAKSFLYALDTLYKTLQLLAKMSSAPSEIGEVLGKLTAAFPNLIKVRDSAHHAEDRAQGKAHKRRIALKPISNNAISAPQGGVLVIDMLNGNRYGGTLADGTFGEIEVSSTSAIVAQQCVQRVLNCYQWSGPSEHFPR